MTGKKPRKPRILLVDPYAPAGDYLAKRLDEYPGKRDYDYKHIKSLKGLAGKVREYKPNVIILRADNPSGTNCNGINAYWRLRRLGLTKGRNVIFARFDNFNDKAADSDDLNDETAKRIKKTGRPSTYYLWFLWITDHRRLIYTPKYKLEKRIFGHPIA